MSSLPNLRDYEYLQHPLQNSERKQLEELFRRQGRISQCREFWVDDDSFSTLRSNEEFDEAVINFYFALIAKRVLESGSQTHSPLPSSYEHAVVLYSAYFVPFLQAGDHDQAHLATIHKSKTRTSELDLAVIPINVDNLHWITAVVNYRQHRFEMYDSLPSKRSLLLQASTPLHCWTDWVRSDYPYQANGSNDCGLACCLATHAVVLGHGFFDIHRYREILRERVALEIGRSKLFPMIPNPPLTRRSAPDRTPSKALPLAGTAIGSSEDA
ncbi:cysteine proteinase [Calocera cornea HHB12733]|uniref:Cysteine proteinase n=1 Tax=Calocera cornea HHB12733 TaxID=1353952 RepID=A0A165C0S8_9BASI|nr:cysteine proteinase [Calocera cornea HHB12733]